MDANLIAQAHNLWNVATYTADFDPPLCREQNAAATEVYWLGVVRQGVDFDMYGRRVYCKQHDPVSETFWIAKPDDYLTIHTCRNCGAVLDVE